MNTLKEDAGAMLETMDAVEVEKKHARLTPSDRTLIFKLHAKGNLKQSEIAAAVGCDASTVCRTLALIDTRAEARVILESGAAQLAHTVVSTKDAGIALKALGKVDVVREDAAQGGNNVVVMVGTGEHPLLPPTIADLRSLPATSSDAA